jgi:hypothetical protein
MGTGNWHALFNAEGNVDQYGSKPYALRGSPHQMESTIKRLRLIRWALLASIPLFAWVAEIGRGSGSSDWTWRHWLAIGCAVWSISGAFRVRGRLLRSSKEKSVNDAAAAKGAKQWEAGQVFSLGVAESVASWGLAIRMVFHGTLWQASIFYVMGAFLLLLWTPRMPSGTPPT